MNEKKALIYCRVSSERQKREGHGLEGQEKRCRDHARQNGYVVPEDGVFHDSYTGAGDFMQRPAMRQLIEYIDENDYNEYAVVFDDLKRLARDVVAHMKLRTEFKARNVDVLCPNFNFEDTPEGHFVETIIAAQGELERKQNKRQVKQKQRARLEKGYWTFYQPPGYTYEKHPTHGKILIPKEPECHIIKEALEGFAHGRFKNLTEIQAFFIKNKLKHPRHLSRIKDLLRRSIYAGIIEYTDWEVEPRPGHHQAIISAETYDLIQDRLLDMERTSRNTDTDKDFPLRGYICCSVCLEPCTASWSTGRSKQYPYYRCRNSLCKMRTKSSPCDTAEERLLDLLRQTRPEEGVFDLTGAIIDDVWSTYSSQVENIKKSVEREIKEIDCLLDRITKAKTDAVLDAYEGKIDKLKKEQKEKSKKIHTESNGDDIFGTTKSLVFEILKNPAETWEKGDLEDKYLVMNLTFDGLLPYDKENGFGTAQMSPVIRLFNEFETSGSHGVDKSRFEIQVFVHKEYYCSCRDRSIGA